MKPCNPAAAGGGSGNSRRVLFNIQASLAAISKTDSLLPHKAEETYSDTISNTRTSPQGDTHYLLYPGLGYMLYSKVLAGKKNPVL